MKYRFKFEDIHHLIQTSLQSCQVEVDSRGEDYSELLHKNPPIPFPKDLRFQIEYNQQLLFSMRIRYCIRIIDNAIAEHLNNAFSRIDESQDSDLALYILKLTREASMTLIHDADGYCQQLPVTPNSLTEVKSNRYAKENLITLHYIIAALVRCYMEMQERYKNLITDAELYGDADSFFTASAGWIEVPLVRVKPTEKANGQEGKRKKTIPNNCSFQYLKSNPEDWNFNMSCFYRKLIQYGMIPEDTDQNVLLSIFRGAPTTAKLTWLGKNANLKTIIFILIDEGAICTRPKTCTHWQVVSQRFVRPNGEPMPNISSETNRTKDAAMIKDILSSLL